MDEPEVAALDVNAVDADAGATRDVAEPDVADVGPPCQPYDASALDAAAVAAGMNIVIQNSCFKCHQLEPIDAGLLLSGSDVPAGFGCAAYPPNLTPDPTTGLGCWTDLQIVNAILNGVDNQDAALCVMPEFGPRFMDAGMNPTVAALDIAAFLRTLQPVSHQVADTICSKCPGGGGGTGADSGATADGAPDASGG